MYTLMTPTFMPPVQMSPENSRLLCLTAYSLSLFGGQIFISNLMSETKVLIPALSPMMSSPPTITPTSENGNSHFLVSLANNLEILLYLLFPSCAISNPSVILSTLHSIYIHNPTSPQIIHTLIQVAILSYLDYYT